ncbi:uncharacterized protein N7479_009866 [Penicillium vulpinum]|uniref:Protein kinase domain-containing protein n=1 Tax=Penicillium vulpinum TaxID=29845 RepID=A0A1V6RY45_9EURO|nr:uncharacterized protein N7479_009866 [Penicillium vulpinum]KAJ5951453.1 hypothetical protein N7479_009866 [Penicillium vulpinum]OQE06691.1 hypothetical protein PENVUL_c017G08897 [Penicillium vulpinum]
MTDDYDDILNSLDDNYYSLDGDDLSPTLQAWSNSSDLEEFDLDSLNLSPSDSSWTDVDPLESAITATRNGSAPILSTLSQFTAILSQTGIHGPRLIRPANLSTRATKIGSGTQFTVFKDPIFEREVVKRVNVPLSNTDQRFSASIDYRLQLRTVVLEVLSLCNPVIRAHPNITSLVAWGFDFPFANMPVPVLFMEEAMTTLGEFLASEKRGVGVMYQLALGVANGLEGLHNLNIVHGDVKPDNVLVFVGPTKDMPFQAKLSDFGVCVDLETPEGKFSLSDYRGTPAWLAPEVVNGDVSRFGGFSPELMFKFDSYSFGLVLVSIFTGGEIPVLNTKPDRVKDQISKWLNPKVIPSDTMRNELCKATLKLLSEDPRDRPLPNATLLKIDTPEYNFWFSSIQSNSATTHVGAIDPIYNKGPLFWYRLDESIRKELEAQHTLSKGGNAPPFAGDVLFGIAQTITGEKPTYLDRMLTYLGDAARAGHSPARAVYAQIMEAHGQTPEFSKEVLEEWMLQAVAEGYLFAKPGQLGKKVEEAKERFRSHGGFCPDPFLGKSNVKAAMNREKALEWKKKNGNLVDRKRNTILHATAAFGAVDALQGLMDDAKIAVDVENDNAETPLYKAFQAGHTQVIKALLDHGASASCRTRQKITPLHWLFMIPEGSIREIAKQMIEKGADVNALVEPVKENTSGFAEKIQILHYPFELPHGSPLHWACFFRNMTAIETLISLGANVNAIYHGLDASTTPLALAAFFGEPTIARYLTSHGADGTLLDSRGRNNLHGMTEYFPDRHGYLRYHWHYWIRHGTWEHHLEQTADLVKILVKAGADINAKNRNRPALTPIAAAADRGCWDGGTICALLDAGADLEESILTAGDAVLHSWVSIVGPRLDYTDSYLPTLKKIVKAMPNLDVRNWSKATPLHDLTTIYHPEDEFEAACEIFLAHSPPADINAKTGQGESPLAIALDTDLDPARRCRFLLKKGADPLVLNSRERDIFYIIANNKVLNDQDSHDLIRDILLHLSPDIQKAYTNHYLHNPNSNEPLFAAAEKGKPLTLKLLLSLGLTCHINKPIKTKFSTCTPLDRALHSAELGRRAYIQGLASYKLGAARTKALEQNLVYDVTQGPPARAAESYRSFPEVIRILRDAGAKRTCELEGSTNGDYIEQPKGWDQLDIQKYGFTVETQPNFEAWKGLYELASYQSGWSSWLEKLTGK